MPIGERFAVRDFPFAEELERLLRSPEAGEWLRNEKRDGAAPAVDEDGRLIFRLENDVEAARFAARWLNAK